MTTPRLARRLAAIQPSATLAISERAAALRQKGIDVISFGLGEPDFPTPTHIRQAAKDAIDRGETRYTPVRGIPRLVDAILADSRRRRGVEHGRREVVVSTGAKHSLYNLSVALFEPGDEVLIPSPYWVSYPEQVERFAGATPVAIPTKESEGFHLQPDALRAAITARTRALILCSPSNPTGSAYPEAQLRALAQVLREHEIFVIVDEIYGQLVYDGFRQTSLLTIAPERFRDRLIVVDGASKTYAMTGWRIGWILAPEVVAEACERVQGQATSGACGIAQHAAVAALDPEHTAELTGMLAEFGVRRKLAVDGLNAIPGIRCRMPEGAFYAFPSVERLLGRRTAEGRVLSTDIDVCDWLIDAAKVALVPGTAFGAPGYVRLSYATSRALVSEGLSRIATAVATLVDA